jgi:hypothetical protein
VSRGRAAALPAVALRPRRRSLRTVGRDLAVALVSAAVVAFLVAYALTTPRFALDATVAGVESHPGSRALVAGRMVDTDGDGVANARVEVRRRGAPVRVAHSDGHGAFRLDLGGACAAARIDLAAEQDGRRVHTTLTRRLCPGSLVEIDARLVAAGRLIWLPTR